MKTGVYIALFSLCLNGYADDITQNILLSNNQQTFQVSLPANATTGYQWYSQDYNRDLLSLQDYRYETGQSKGTKIVGQGGKAIFLFNVDPRFFDAPQVTTLTFVYQQPNKPGQNKSSATVTVSAASSNNDSFNWQKYPTVDDTKAVNPDFNPDSNTSTNWLSLPNAKSNS